MGLRYFYYVTTIVPQTKFGVAVLLFHAVLSFDTREYSIIQAEKYGDWFTYDKTPRALIFKRDHSKVVDLESMERMMRYNDFKNDPLSACQCTPLHSSAENAISAR